MEMPEGLSKEERDALWGIHKECFHKWLVGLTDKELNEVGSAVYAVMDYRVRMASQQDVGNLN